MPCWALILTTAAELLRPPPSLVDGARVCPATVVLVLTARSIRGMAEASTIPCSATSLSQRQSRAAHAASLGGASTSGSIRGCHPNRALLSDAPP
eukprot:6147181-Pyramimonas_sp.AAC.1